MENDLAVGFANVIVGIQLTKKAFRDWAIANGYSDDLTIDRIDVNGNYCPENCGFITRAENNKNRRRIKRGKNNECK